MSAITDFEVTYGGALATNKFHRIVDAAGAGVDMNAGTGSSVYLWYKKGDEAPIVDIQVLYDDEATPEGYVKVAKDLIKGASNRAYLAFRRQTEGDTTLPITGVKLLPSDAAEEGFEKLGRPVNQANKLSLFVKRLDPSSVPAASSDGPKWTIAQIKVGDWFDCKDSYEQWQVAKATAVTASGIAVTYKGYSKYYDEVVPKAPSRLAELGTHTNGSTVVTVQGYNSIQSLVEYEATAAKVDTFIDGTMLEEDREKFAKSELPNALEAILTSRFPPDLIEGGFAFIKKSIEFVVHCLKSVSPLERKTVQMFERVLLADDSCNYFFCTYGATRPGMPAAEGVDGRFLSLPDGGASRFYVGAVNFFGECGGFDEMIRRLEQREPLLPLTEAASFVDSLWVCKYCSTRHMIEDVVPRFRKALFDRIKDMTDLELRDADRNVFGQIISKLEELIRTVMRRWRGVTTENADETMESMGLVTAYRMLVCPYMSQRLKGLSDIKEMLERVQLYGTSTGAARGGQYDMYRRNNYGYGAAVIVKPTVWLTPEKFAQWLVENQVVEVCLGERVNGKVFDVHLESLKRLTTIVAFLAEQQVLTVAHVQRLWKIAAESGDSNKRAVFDILTTAAKSMSEEHFDALFTSLSSVNVSDFDGPLLSLITTLTKHGLLATAGNAVGGSVQKLYGLDLLWRAVSSEEGLPEDVAATAEKAFIDNFLGRSDLLPRYIELCAKNVRARTGTEKALKLLMALLRSLPIVSARADPFASQRSAVAHLNSTYDIVNLVIADLQQYKSEAAEAAAKMGYAIPCNDSTGGDAAVFVRKEAHLNAVSTRLDFLGFLISSGALDLTLEVVDVLWTELVLNNITAAEREAFAAWLLTAMESAANLHHTGSGTIVDKIFDKYMMNDEKARYPSLGPSGFAAFDFAFRSTNIRDRKLRSSGGLLVLDLELEGLDGLWLLASEALNPDVFKSATDLLINLHFKLAPQLMENKGDAWEGFVSRCMEIVHQALAELKTGSLDDFKKRLNERRVEAALTMVQRFLNMVEDSGKKSREHYTVPWTITFTYNDGDVVKTIMLPEKPTVGQLRVEAGAKIKFTPDRIRVQKKDRKGVFSCEEWDDKYYEDTGLPSGVATCMPLVRPLSDTEQFDEERIYPKVDMSDPDRARPRELLCNSSEYFETLFDVLSLSRDSVVASSWSLIQLLPINARISQAITAITEGSHVDFNELYSPVAPLKLLYSLRITDKYANPSAKETPEVKASYKAWCDAFVARGGVTHLLKILATCDIDSWMQSTLTQNCLTLLLNLVVAFLGASRFESGAGFLSDVDVKTIVDKLLRGIEAAVRSAATVSDSSNDEDDGVFEVQDEGALALAKKKKAKQTKDAGTGGDMEDEDLLDLNDNNTSSDVDSTGEPGSDPREMLQSKLAPSTKDSQLVQAVLGLYTVLAFQEPAVRGALVAEATFPTVLAGLLKVKDVSVRSEMEKGISLLCASLALRAGVVSERDAFLKLLIPNIDTAYVFDGTCTEFFALLARLLRLKPDTPPDVDVGALVSRLSSLITTHPVVEVTVEQEDFLLRGLLAVAASILSVYPDLKGSAIDLINEVFHNCLFAVPTASTPRDAPPPKCKHATSRKIAFAFLEELSRDCPENLAKLCELMVPHHQNPAVAISKRGYSMPALPKSSTGYVGLKNLGCICYMNATNQNFFMIPEFRRGVLEYEDHEDDKKESLMFQLQRMFAFLQETDKQCYNPKGFCYAFKDWEGNPTNTFVQKDASEYLGMLFMQMEMKLQGSPQEHVIKNCFGGTLENELIAEGKYSAREEPFTFLSIEVKNKKDLYSAMRGFISGETVDYRWENKDGSKTELPTQKRSSLKQLPNHLIIHLKRFEFDYETMQNSKLNDRFEFPRELDMYDFTSDGRPDKVAAPKEDGEPETKSDDASSEPAKPREYYKYELAGCVIHSGTAHAGHYYSFVRERVGNKLGKWMMFNDSSVTPFNPDYLEREAFGGVETYKYAYSGLTQSHAVTRNAFVLFYDRVPAEAPGTTAADVESLIAAQGGSVPTQSSPEALADLLVKAHRSRSAAVGRPATIPSEIYELITSDNTGFWRERNIYDKVYFGFLSSLLQSGVKEAGEVVPYPSTPLRSAEDAVALGGSSFRVIRLATLFVFNTLATSAQKAQWATWVQRLQSQYESNAVACVWLLQLLMSNHTLLKRILFEGESSGIPKLLSTVVKQVAQAELPLPEPGTVAPVKSTFVPVLRRGASGDLDLNDTKAAEPEPEQPLIFGAPHGIVAASFVETLLQQLPTAGAEWLKFGAYFDLWTGLVEGTVPEFKQYLKARGLISTLVGFFLDGDSPLPEYNVTPASDTDAVVGAGRSNLYDIDGIPSVNRRKKMGSAYYLPEFLPLLKCLKKLVLSSLPPSGVASVMQEPPATPLSDSDALMLSSDQFLAKLMSGDPGIDLPISRLLVKHIVWNDEGIAVRLADVMKNGIIAADGEALASWFVVLGELLDVDDSLKDRRLDLFLSATVAAMHSQQNYYKATEIALTRLIGMAKNNIPMRQWIFARRATLRWMADWLRVNVRPPAYYAAGPMKLNKSAQSYYYANEGAHSRSPAYLERMTALLDGRPVTYSDFDAHDDQTAIIGRRIAVVFPSQKWYLGRVNAFDADKGQHLVKFDDGEEKWYNLHSGKLTYKFVKEATVLSPWYPPTAVDEAPFMVTVPGVRAAGEILPDDEDDQPQDDQQVNQDGYNQDEDEEQKMQDGNNDYLRVGDQDFSDEAIDSDDDVR